MIRIGTGFDVHAFDDKENQNNYVILCGVKIPYKYRILAHSDGDVALHALTDALLGSVAEGSIGQHFPPTDDKWKNCSSEVFLIHANNLIKTHKFAISNIDITIICQEPKIMPYALQMRQNIATILCINLNQINVKAVTTEGLGAIGRKEGVAVQASVLITSN